MNVKLCKRCQETKPLKWFSVDNRKPDKLNYMCKICSSNYLRECRAKQKSVASAKKNSN